MRTIILLACGFLFCVSASASGRTKPGDPVLGKQASQSCQACHGADGNKTIDGQYPKLAGQHAAYLLKALRDYKSGARDNAVMKGLAGPLSEADIANIAAYYGSLSGDLKTMED